VNNAFAILAIAAGSGAKASAAAACSSWLACGKPALPAAAVPGLAAE
jgi:hypothetical protein